jgi:hypothetical protein
VLALAEVHETRECEGESWVRPWQRRQRSWQRDEDDDWLEDLDPEPDDPDAYIVGDLIDSSVTLEHWIDEPSGGGAPEPVATAVADEEVCASTASSALSPHAAEYEGFMGNYGNTMDRWYRRAALVLWPRERAFAVRAEASPGWALKTLQGRLRAGELRESREMAASLLPFWNDVAGHDEQRGQLGPALRVAAGLEAPELAAALLLPFQRELLTPPQARDFVALVARYGELWTRGLLGSWANPPSRGMHFGRRRELLTWLAALRPLCESLRAAPGAAGETAARLLVEDGWRALQQEITERRSLLPPSEREKALAALAKPILGWLGGAAAADGAESAGQPHAAAAPIEQAIGWLCSDDNEALVPCLVGVLRMAAKRSERARTGTVGLSAVARHCAESVAARLATPARAAGDWAIPPPAGCHCALCHRLGAFLSSPERRLEWPLAKQGRQHLHNRIDRHELPVRHETRRKGSPYVLVLEKTDALFTREAAARRAWQSDLDWLSSAGCRL